jgi:Arc/MetJ family transcription regulator
MDVYTRLTCSYIYCSWEVTTLGHRTLVEIDPALLDSAKDILGTTTIKETVDRALREVVRTQAIRDHLQQMHTLEGLDLDDADVMAQAWRPAT